MKAVLLLALSAGPTFAQSSAPPEIGDTSYASRADVQRQIVDMLTAMQPQQGFMWRPVVRDGKTVAAIEIWKKPGRPAVHPADAEYAIVLEGTGTLISGGTMLDQTIRRADLVEGSRIENGVKRVLGPGDVILIPAGVPHWFGIAGDRLILLGVKLHSSTASQ